MEICFNSISFTPVHIWTNSRTLLDTAETLAEIGFDTIEIAAGRPHAWPSDLSPAERSSLVKHFDRLGLRVSAVCPLISPNLNPASLSDHELRDARDYMVECVRLASDLESQLVVYPAGWVIPGTSTDEAWQRSCETLQIAAEEGRKRGVSLVVRPYAGFHQSSMEQRASFENGFHIMSSQCPLDDGYIPRVVEGGPQDVIRKYSEHLLHVHLVDISESA